MPCVWIHRERKIFKSQQGPERLSNMLLPTKEGEEIAQFPIKAINVSPVVLNVNQVGISNKWRT